MPVAAERPWEAFHTQATSGEELKERIRLATEKALVNRNRFAETVAHQLTAALAQARKDVAVSILGLKSLGALPGSKIIQLKGLQELKSEINDVLAQLRRTQNLTMRKGVKESFHLGIQNGIGEFTEARLPQYLDLTPEGIGKLARQAFTLIDTDALDFQSQYALQLAGSVHGELHDGIHRTLLSGIATGKGAKDIVRDLGEVVKEPDNFRQAWNRTFSKAQYRMELIARTEVLRAHNQGRLKFHDRVGVRKLEWLTMADERVCPVCGPLDGKVFVLERFPRQPLHPNCRCSSITAWPLTICGGTLGAKSEDLPSACLLPPQAIESQALALAEESKKLSQVFGEGAASDLATLTFKQLQTLAKQNSVSVARNLGDFSELLKKAEPDIDLTNLGGKNLAAKLKEHSIGALRNKEELVALLSQKQAAFQEAKVTAQPLQQLPSPGGLRSLSLTVLKDLAIQKGVSLKMNKQDLLDWLDLLEPGVDHSGLSGQALVQAKGKFSIGPLKNKSQLIRSIEKTLGHELAEKVEQEALAQSKLATHT